MSDSRTMLVAAGYDAMADTWEAWSAQIADDPRLIWLGKLTERLPDDADVLELGCGNGTVETRELARRSRLIAVDLSAGVGDRNDWFGEWLGVPMYFSAFDAAGNRSLLASYEVLEDEVVHINEPQGRVPFHWVLARR